MYLLHNLRRCSLSPVSATLSSAENKSSRLLSFLSPTSQRRFGFDRSDEEAEEEEEKEERSALPSSPRC